jgi:hypothetical protein
MWCWTSAPWFPLDAVGDERITEVISVYVKYTNEDHPTAILGWRFVDKVDSTGFTEPSGLYLPAAINLSTGDSFYIATRRNFSVVTDIDAASPVIPIVANYAVYKLLGAAEVARTHDPGRRTDRTVQPGAEGRSSIWYLREAERLRVRETARLAHEEYWLPKNRIQQRARRYRP